MAKQKTKQRANTSTHNSSPLYQWIARILLWPRPVRILVVAIVSLATVLAVSPLIDRIYLENFYAPATVILPSLLAALFGLGMYIVGWWLIVGTIGEYKQVSAITSIYILAGVTIVVGTMIWGVRLALLNSV